MNSDFRSILETAALTAAIALAGSVAIACSSSSSAVAAGCPAADGGCPAQEAGCPAAEAGCPAATPGTAQAAPTGAATDIDAWLAKGDYKAWTCEPAPKDPVAGSPSPHTKNRVCSNALSSAHMTGEYPTGAANVKELYDAAGTKIVGYAIEQKMKSGGGDAWYWYEVNGGVVANGYGASGVPKNLCVGCHTAAGSDAKHPGHDFVYTQVK